MSFRVVLIENAAKLRYKLDNLLVTIGETETRIPFSDISTIVIDNYDTTLSTRLLGIIAKENITLVICDYNHLPIGIYLGYNTHSRATKVMQKQINMEQRVKDELWAKIVKKKIENQNKVLLKRPSSQLAIDRLKGYFDDVSIGDKTNREGHAAKVYFNELMGKDFSRDDDSYIINSALNYGYAVIRSYIARLCVGYGLNTMIGLFHKNEYNQFNLVDDLMEPLRPIVDLYAIENITDKEFFTFDNRKGLIDLVNHKIIYNNKNQYIANALDMYIYKYSSALENYDFSALELPDLDNYLGKV